MEYGAVLIFIITYLFFGTELGFTDVSPVYTHFTYSIQHANITHLFFNSLAFIGVCKLVSNFTDKKILLLISFSIAVIASFFSMYSIPTVGCSAVIYAMLGMYIGVTLCKKSIKINKQKYGLFLLSIGIMLTASYFNSTSNFNVHAVALIFGGISGALLSIRTINKT